MPLCKFFMQGSCRFGNKCWNEHPSGGSQGFSVTAQRQLFGKKGQNVAFQDSFGQNQNPYRWIAPDNQQQQQQSRNQQVPIQQISASDIVKGLAGEVTTTWEGGKMWPFSCLGFEKDLPSLPGFTDISPEEMRHDAYDALKQGSIQSYIQKVETAFNQVNVQRLELKNPSMSLKQKLISFIEDCRRKKPNSSTQGSLFSDSNASSNLFGADGGLFGVPNSDQSSSGLFGAQSGFGQQTGTQSVFGQTGSQTSGQTGTQSLFGKSTYGQTEQSNNLFGQSTFGQAQPGGQSGLFGQPSSSTGLFGQEAPKRSLFGQPVTSPFSNGASSSGLSTPFGQSSAQPKTLFGSSVSAVAPEPVPTQTAPVQATNTQPEPISSLYTPLDKLTPQELEQFKAPLFTLGSIPTKQPPKELCFG